MKTKIYLIRNNAFSVDGRIKRRFRSRERTMSNITSTTADDYNSALDSSDMEFYDISDEETSKASTLTPLDDVSSKYLLV